MRRVSTILLAAVVLLLPGFALTGCVTSKKYRLAKDDTPPAQVLGWKASTPSADLTLQSVIVFKGPGSWKREARWDEYGVMISNRGTPSLVIESAQLVDVLGNPQLTGEEPWKLEKLSYTNWDKYGKTGLKVLAGAGAVALYGTAVMASSFGSFMAGPGAATAGGGAAALAVIPIVAVVDITAVAIMNHNNKKKVQEEFDRRRLKLPLTVAPGATAEGSFFFPMTPGPQRLIVKGRSGEAPVELVLELKPLAGLHLKPAEAR